MSFTFFPDDAVRVASSETHKLLRISLDGYRRGRTRARLLSGLFIEQAFPQVTGTNGRVAKRVGGNGGIGTSGKTINGKNGTNTNGNSLCGSGD